MTEHPGTRQPPEPQFPLFPPGWWAGRVNEQRAGLGLRPLTSLDPLAMLLWHGITQPPSSPVVVTGI